MTIQYKRLSSTALFCTVTLMFFAVQFALNNKSDLLKMPLPTNILTGVGVGITSIGTYQLLTKALLFLFGKSIWLRRKVLGKAYIEGTWVGFYKHGNLNRFTIEFIDQSGEETIVHGREFDENNNSRGSWKSALVSVDGVKRCLTYSYTCRMNQAKSPHEGLAYFEMLVPKPGSYPYILEGHSADLTDGDRDPNKEYKISETETSDDYALRWTHEIFVLGKVPTDYPRPEPKAEQSA